MSKDPESYCCKIKSKHEYELLRSVAAALDYPVHPASAPEPVPHYFYYGTQSRWWCLSHSIDGIPHGVEEVEDYKELIKCWANQPFKIKEKQKKWEIVTISHRL
jgi:hypothetical protein